MTAHPVLTPGEPMAWFASLLARDLVQVTDDPAVVDRGGWWAAVVEFEGRARFWRFAKVTPVPISTLAQRERDFRGFRALAPWRGPKPLAWTSSLDRANYIAAVEAVRARIREGEVYQANICRILSAPIAPDADPLALAAVIARGNPAPFAAVVDVPDGAVPRRAPTTGGTTLSGFGVRIVSASPELSLRRRGDQLTSSPVKGTAVTREGLLPKDFAENVMIVDLVRNDLHRVCEPGSVEVSQLLGLHQLPGMVHLESSVEGRLRSGVGWGEILAALTPAGSVSGAPKGAALQAIRDLEVRPRGPYCGAIGWIDADRRCAELAVGIRTFWWEAGLLNFGTGAGITWGSDPVGEWAETELKARRLIALASAAPVSTMSQPAQSTS